MLVARREERLRALADELGGATVIAARPARARRPAAGRGRSSRPSTAASSTCSSTTPAPRGAGGSRRPAGQNVERHMKLDFEAPVRLTEALLPLLRSDGWRTPAGEPTGLDRERGEHRVAGLAAQLRRVFGGEVRARRRGAMPCMARSVRTAFTLGSCSRGSSRPRGSRPPSCSRARTRAGSCPRRSASRTRSSTRAPGEGRALRPAPLLDRGCAADPGAGADPPSDRRRRARNCDRPEARRLS